MTREAATHLGTTPNDALILFAELGARLYAQEIEMARTERLQMQAIVEAAGPVEPDAEYPTEEEAREAGLFLRRTGGWA